MTREELERENAQLRAMLADDPHNVPSKFVTVGGVTYRIWGTSSISAFERLQAELAAVEQRERDWQNTANERSKEIIRLTMLIKQQ